MDNFPVIQGTALPLSVNLLDDQGQALTGFTDEGLEAEVWPGGDRAATFSVDVEWSDAAVGLIDVEVGADQTAGLDPGRYQGAVYLDHPDLGRVTCYRFAVEVLASASHPATPDPDAPPPPPTYCTLADVLRGRPWLRALQDDDDAGGFADQIREASRWLDGLIINRAPRGFGGRTLGSPGSRALLYGDAGGPSPYLRKLLDGGSLVVRDWVRDAVTKRAVSLICEGQLTPGTANDYQALAVRFRRESSNLANSSWAELRTGGPGSVPSIRFALGSGSLR